MQVMGNKKYVTYILRCNDGSYYTGVTDNLEKRMLQHEMGEADEFSYTYTRRPVVLLHSEEYDSPHEAIQREKQLQGWSRKKKEALIRGDIDSLKKLSKNKKNREKMRSASARPSTSQN